MVLGAYAVRYNAEDDCRHLRGCLDAYQHLSHAEYLLYQSHCGVAQGLVAAPLNRSENSCDKVGDFERQMNLQGTDLIREWNWMRDLVCPLYIYLNLDILFCPVHDCGFFLTDKMEFICHCSCFPNLEV